MDEVRSFRFTAQDEPVCSMGALVDSSSIRFDVDGLRSRMQSDGYLFLRGMLDRKQVLNARRFALNRLAESGALDLSYPLMDAVAAPTARNAFMPELLAKDNDALLDVLYNGPMLAFFRDFFGEPAMHYNFTWFRSIPPGKGTPAHCDVVYMGRGERERLFTAWTPVGDIDYEQGGLMILESSHRHQRLKSTYGQMDVDAFCENKPMSAAWGKSWGTGGYLKANLETIRNSIGGRWLTTQFQAGDVLIFSVFTVHASLDNQSRRIRLSSDSRYQPASSTADDRWIGENPVGHGAAGKRGKIC